MKMPNLRHVSLRVANFALSIPDMILVKHVYFLYLGVGRLLCVAPQQPPPVGLTPLSKVNPAPRGYTNETGLMAGYQIHGLW
jgi:hypothetical protein